MVRNIESQILSKQLKPGDKLQSERELAKSYLVSRTVIREAIKTLEQKGLVQAIQGKGIFIIKPRPEMIADSIYRVLAHNQATMEHLVEARELLETAIISLAAQRVTPIQLEQLEKNILFMDQYIGQTEAFLFYDLAFHNTLGEAAQNPIYLIFMNSILELIQKQRLHMAMQSPASMSRAQQHHRAIYQALQHHDQQQAIRAAEGHFNQIRKDIEGFKNMEITRP